MARWSPPSSSWIQEQITRDFFYVNTETANGSLMITSITKYGFRFFFLVNIQRKLIARKSGKSQTRRAPEKHFFS